MITTTIRPFTEAEKKQQIQQLPSVYKRFEGFVMKLIFIVFALTIPLLVYDHFVPLSSQTQAVYCIAIVIIAILLTYWITIKWEIFPNTEFEFLRKKGSDEFISFKTLGQYFEEEKTLPPFDKATWDNGTFPANGQMIDQTIDQIN